MTTKAKQNTNGLNTQGLKGGKTMKNTQLGLFEGGQTMQVKQNTQELLNGGNQMEVRDERVAKVLEAIHSETKGFKGLVEEINNPKKVEEAKPVKEEKEVKAKTVKVNAVKEAIEGLKDVELANEYEVLFADKLIADEKEAKAEAKRAELVERMEKAHKKLLALGMKVEAKKLCVIVTKETYNDCLKRVKYAESILTERKAKRDSRLVEIRRRKAELKVVVKASDAGKSVEEMEVSVTETANRGDHKVETITNCEKAVLLACLSYAKENKDYNRFAFLDKKRTNELLKKYTNGLTTIKDIYLKGFRCELISKAYLNNFKFEVPKCDLDIQDLAKDFNNSLVKDELHKLSFDAVEKLKETEIKDITNYKSTFAISTKLVLNSVLKNYDSTIVEMYNVLMVPEKLTEEEALKEQKAEVRLRIVVDTNTLDVVRRWSVDLPKIGLTGEFRTVNSLYYCSYIPTNLKEYIDGDTNRLLLNHPLRYILEKALSKYQDGKLVPMDKEEFFDIICKSNSERVYKFQKNVKDIMIKAKNNVNDEDLATPLLWTPKLLSIASTYGRRNTVLMEELDYSMLSKIQDRHIEGLDYLTGSTSLPAKRATLSAGYKFAVRKDGIVAIVPAVKDADLSKHVTSYLSELNLIHLVSGKTGGKRNNGPTMSWAYNLANPQRYERHVVNRDCNLSQLKTINSILSTLFVAKIELPANLNPELVKLGLYPNTNDCFLISESTSKRMGTYYAKAHKATKVVHPTEGSKLYGICRDKGSVSSVLRKYRAFVDYSVDNLSEVNELVKSLKLMRGDDVFYKVDEDKLTVTFELDVIANPSTGRDNVGAIFLQSALETRAMLDGKFVGYTTEEVARMNVKEEVAKVKIHQRVYLVDSDNKEVFNFGDVAVIMEDFFWQPQHDNRGYIREKNINIFYNQGIAGLHTFAPTWYRYVLNSAKFDALKQTMLALNLGLINEVNNKTSEEALKKVDSLENYLSLLGFDDETVNEIKQEKAKVVEEPKFETLKGILRTFDPKLGVAKQRLYSFLNENVNNLNDVKDSVLTIEDLIVLSTLMNGENGKLIRDLLWNNVKQSKELTKLIDWINSKNIFKFELEDGEERTLFLPYGLEEKVEFFNVPKEETSKSDDEEELFEYSDEEMSDEVWEAFDSEEDFKDEKRCKYDYNEGSVLDYKHMALINVGLAYFDYINADTDEDKTDKKAKFLAKVNQFNYQLRTLFSKEFKTIYNWKMNGISGVILPANKGIDGIELPLWYCEKHSINRGDKVLVFRDPIQGLFLELEVRGYTKQEIRIHSTILTWLGGDHDGDKLQVVPVNGMISDNIEYIEDEAKLREELDTLLPSRMLDNPVYAEILSEKDLDFSLDEANYSNNMISLLDDSKKSSRYYEAVSMEDYFQEYQVTVLNMRTVKEGTATAGSFANWLYEIAELEGLDLVSARTLGDRIQQLALDSKHTQGGNGFEDSMWFAITKLRFEAQKVRIKPSILESKIEFALGNKIEPKTKADNMEMLFGF